MKKQMKPQTNGNVFKTMVRNVVKEEVSDAFEKQQKFIKTLFTQQVENIDKKFDNQNASISKKFKQMNEKLDDKFEEYYTKYRDETLTKLDPAMGRLKKIDETQEMHASQHSDINDRLEKLEHIHPHGKHA